MGIFSQIINAIFGKPNNPPDLSKDTAVYSKSAPDQKIIKLAEDAVTTTNESLRIANESTDIETRIRELNNARVGLATLKTLSAQYTYLTLQRLQAVEETINGIEAETRALTFIPLTPPAGNTSSIETCDSERRLSERDEQSALKCIQDCFRVVNESIDIARKSKNIETKLSRLGVARKMLNEAQRQATQFSLKVDGFVAAEAEINRIDEAIKSGTPTEITGMPHIEINDPFASPARDLLKEATVLKKEKKFDEACNKLREAYSAEGSENLMIEERLRLAMYLQLAGQNDQGWEELNRLLAKYTDEFSQPIIKHQMNVFLRKENNETASNPVRVITSEVEPKLVENGNKAPSLSKTVSELQREPISAWYDSDLISGLKFSATLQLRTPLRILLRHGEKHTERTKPAPQIAQEAWEGIWVPKLKLMGDKEFGTMASDVGQIPPNGGDYLPFLIEVRKIVESYAPIEQRVTKLREMLAVNSRQDFISKHGGIERIVDYFFHSPIRSMPTLPTSTMNMFVKLDLLYNPSRLAAATDEELMSFKGIGPAKLKAIREHCEDMAKLSDADRGEDVIR